MRSTALLARVLAVSLLGGLAALQWGAMQAPPTRGRMLLCVVIAVVAAVAIHATAAWPSRGRRRAAAAVASSAVVVAVLLAAGVPTGLLDPRSWGALAEGLGQGIQALPGIGVPYRGLDPWIHVVLVVSGGLLLSLGAALAVRALRDDRRPLGGALLLAAAYVIPVVERPPASPLLGGAVFTLLLGALLWGDRVERAHAPAAGVFVLIALVGAVPAAARLDRDEPWVDYRALVQSLATPPAVGFDWDHGYGPLDWPRENRVMLRVSAEVPAYWKALDLETFDGQRWIARDRLPPGTATETAPNHADWTRGVRVSVRDLRSRNYVTGGVGLEVSGSPRLVVPAAPGTFTTGIEELRRGDTYAAEIYAPNPSVRELRGAGTAFPSFVEPYLRMDLPPEVGGPVTQVEGAPSTLGPLRVEFPEFGLLSFRTPPAGVDASGGYYGTAGPLLEASEYAPMWALARRLRRDATTPYEYVRLVQAHLSQGDYVYDERPPAPGPGRPPLVSFLFDTKTGYCQQFSGAMALLLRMGGVPARVSSGFSPGTYDDERDQWVVRDVDAHSWVEAYFPGLGWVTFDPSPGVAPPNTQLLNGPAPLSAPDVPLRPDARRADVPEQGAGAEVPGGPGEQGTVSPWLLGALALLGGVVAAAALTLRERRRRAGTLTDLQELERALRRTGRPVEPGTTLQVLERRLRDRSGAGSAAAGYVAAVRLARYGGRPAGPTPEQRTALREELGAGLGPLGRLRAWWALPPVRRRPSRAYNRG